MKGQSMSTQPKYFEVIVDAATGETTIRNYTTEEIARAKAEQATYEAEVTAKEAARQAVLDRLGLTADEVRLLLG